MPEHERERAELTYRTARLEVRRAADKDRVLEFPVSSEEPVRRFFGWEVLDHKPRHVIIRVGRNGRLVMRDGDLLWGLVDYELLYRYKAAAADSITPRTSAPLPGARPV